MLNIFLHLADVYPDPETFSYYQNFDCFLQESAFLQKYRGSSHQKVIKMALNMMYPPPVLFNLC